MKRIKSIAYYLVILLFVALANFAHNKIDHHISTTYSGLEYYFLAQVLSYVITTVLVLIRTIDCIRYDSKSIIITNVISFIVTLVMLYLIYQYYYPTSELAFSLLLITGSGDLFSIAATQTILKKK